MSIQSDVDRGLEILDKLARLNLELKALEDRLETAGLAGDQIPLEDKDREGRQWIAKGSKHQVAVIFTADSIIGSFADGSVVHGAIKVFTGNRLAQFFKLTWANKFKDGKVFRAHATELLGANAPEFITACLSRDKEGVPKSKVVIAWHEAKAKE